MIVWYSAPPASAPDPRLTARSMLSPGTELFFAFWIASNSVGLPRGWAPPTRAATSMFLISLANILPRLASTTAFLCFVVAHLEWPLIRPCSSSAGRAGSSPPRDGGLPDRLAEQLVHPSITGQLGVERGGQYAPLPNRDDPTGGRSRTRDLGHPGEHLDLGIRLLDPGRADEHRTHRATADLGEVQVRLERVDLPAEGVAPDHDVQPAELLLIGPTVQNLAAEQDHSRAGPVGRHPVAQAPPQRLEEVERDEQPADRGGLPARDDQCVDLRQLRRPADEATVQPALGQRSLVLADIALQAQHADERNGHGCRD